MKKNIILEEYKRMQKLAGIQINENQASNLIDDGVILYASDDSKLAPGFVDPKEIGFIVYNTAIKDTSKSILSVTGNLSKNKKVIDIFSDNYPNTDSNYIKTFFTNSSEISNPRKRYMNKFF